jgi:hypothetical protein
MIPHDLGFLESRVFRHHKTTARTTVSIPACRKDCRHVLQPIEYC